MPSYKTELGRLYIRLKSTNETFLAICFLAAILIIASAGFLLLKDEKPNKNIVVPRDTCAIDKTISFTCYKKQLSDIVEKSGPQTAMALLKQQYTQVGYVKSQCHQLVHVVGRAALAKYDYDLGQVYTNGDHFCASGYFHGASEQIVKDKGAKYIISNAEAACKVFADKERYSLDHYNCVHGLGHGLMEATNLELFEAIKICEAFEDDWELRSCDGGVFMQNIMIALSPDESDDQTSKYLKADDPMYPCTAVEEKHQWGCYIIQSSWALSQVGYDYGKVFVMCDAVGNQELRSTCYQSIGRDASGLQGYDIEKTKAACMQGGSSEAKLNCFIGSAKDFVYYYHNDNEAHQLCRALATDLRAACLSAADSYFATFR